MKSMKTLPESCITCICHLSNMRSCRKYDCKDFPVHERVCASIEFDTSVQKALDRYEIRLKSSCRAAKEQLEKDFTVSEDENKAESDTAKSDSVQMSSSEIPDEDKKQKDDETDEDSLESDDSDIPWTAED